MLRRYQLIGHLHDDAVASKTRQKKKKRVSALDAGFLLSNVEFPTPLNIRN